MIYAKRLVHIAQQLIITENLLYNLHPIFWPPLTEIESALENNVFDEIFEKRERFPNSPSLSLFD